MILVSYLGGVSISRASKVFVLLSWSRLFREARSGVEKGIVIQELERPPPSEY